MWRTDHDDSATQCNAVDCDVLVGEQRVVASLKQSVPVAVVVSVIARTQTRTLTTLEQAFHLLSTHLHRCQSKAHMRH